MKKHSSFSEFKTFVLHHCVLFSLIALYLGCANGTNKDDHSAAPGLSGEPLVKSVEKNDVKLVIKVSPKQPRLSDLVDLTITIVHPSTITVEPPVFGQSVGDFAVRDYSERTSVEAPVGKIEATQQPDRTDGAVQSITKKVIRYQLEPMFSGKHLIRSIPIVLIKRTAQGTDVREVLQSEPIEVDVVSEFGDVSADLSQVDPMSDPVAPKQSFLWFGILAFMVLGAVFIAILLLIRKRSTQYSAAPMLSPEEVAQLALSQLISEELPSRGMVKEFYLRLTGIVRVFIEGKTGLRAPEQTTEEFLKDMRASSRFDGLQANQLQEFLIAADLVKYAGQTPDQTSILKSLDRAREFISIRFNEMEAPPQSPVKEVVDG